MAVSRPFDVNPWLSRSDRFPARVSTSGKRKPKTDDNYLTKVFRMGSLLMPTFDGECFHPVLNRRNILQLSRRSQQPGHGESPVVCPLGDFPFVHVMDHEFMCRSSQLLYHIDRLVAG